MQQKKVLYFFSVLDAERENIVESDNKQSINRWTENDVTINWYSTGYSIVVNTLPIIRSLHYQWVCPKRKRNKKKQQRHEKICVHELFATNQRQQEKKPCRNAIWLQVFQADHYISWVYIISLDRVATFLQQIARSSVLRVQRLFWRARQKKKSANSLQMVTRRYS